MFKKNRTFFFLMLMSLWALEACRKKRNYCIKNQNKSSSREKLSKKKIVHQCFALLIITLHRILFFPLFPPSSPI